MSDVKTYELTTVTYGTSSASYLATRCLQHLTEQHASTFPAGSVRVKRDFYIDDLLTGADTIQEARSIQNEIIQLLRLGAFEFSKWTLNCSELLKPVDDQGDKSIAINDGKDS